MESLCRELAKSFLIDPVNNCISSIISLLCIFFDYNIFLINFRLFIIVSCSFCAFIVSYWYILSRCNVDTARGVIVGSRATGCGSEE